MWYSLIFHQGGLQNANITSNIQFDHHKSVHVILPSEVKRTKISLVLHNDMLFSFTFLFFLVQGGWACYSYAWEKWRSLSKHASSVTCLGYAFLQRLQNFFRSQFCCSSLIWRTCMFVFRPICFNLNCNWSLAILRYNNSFYFIMFFLTEFIQLSCRVELHCFRRNERLQKRPYALKDNLLIVIWINKNCSRQRFYDISQYLVEQENINR